MTRVNNVMLKRELKENKIYILDINTLAISEICVDKNDESFMYYKFKNNMCHYWLKGADIQNISISCSGSLREYLVSLDNNSLVAIREALKETARNVIAVYKKANDEVFNHYFGWNY